MKMYKNNNNESFEFEALIQKSFHLLLSFHLLNFYLKVLLLLTVKFHTRNNKVILIIPWFHQRNYINIISLGSIAYIYVYFYCPRKSIQSKIAKKNINMNCRTLTITKNLDLDLFY